MSRNRKPEYIKRVLKTPAPNGYKFDISNYLYNPSCDYDYPSFVKIIAETSEMVTYRRVYYFKHYNGTGEYWEEIYSMKKNGGEWQVIENRNRQKKVLESANRFNLKKLLSFC